MWRPSLLPSDALAARYRPEHLLAIPTKALTVLFQDEPTAAAARRALEGLPPAVREHLQTAVRRDNLARARERSPWPPLASLLAWELLYWNEPELYDRLTEGEPLHHQVLAELPLDGATVLEVGAGTGRLTVLCAARAARVYALEPVGPLRALLERRISGHALSNVEVLDGWCHAIPLPDGHVDLSVSASAFGANPARGGDLGLRQLRRVTRAGGQIAVLWPDDPGWFLQRGFCYMAFGGAMEVRFRDLHTAVEAAGIFYGPQVRAFLARTGRPTVPFDVIGINAPRDVCLTTVR